MTSASSLTIRSRWPLWLSLLAISAWLAWEKPGIPSAVDAEVVQARAPSPPLVIEPQTETTSGGTTRSVRPVPSTLVPRFDLFPPEHAAPQKDLFASVDWTPPPPPQPLVQPPPPVAPPLPFTFVGKRRADGVWLVFLGRGDEVLIVQEGQTLASQYRIDSVAPPQMTLTYLPLGQKQSLAIGESQ